MFAVQGKGANSDEHRHHALHLLLAREGRLNCVVDGVACQTAGLLTPPDCLHAVEAKDRMVLLLFVDPESKSGAEMKRTLHGSARFFDDLERNALVDGLAAQPGGAELQSWIHHVLGVLEASVSARTGMHPAVRRALDLMQTDRLEPSVRMIDVARRVGLSASRFRHVFAEATGTSFRAYVRWLRFQRAAGAISRGSSMTEAAHDAGFHDSAHMTRTFKEMYGIVPSQLRSPSLHP